MVEYTLNNCPIFWDHLILRSKMNIAAVSVLALMLVGCGSSGDDNAGVQASGQPPVAPEAKPEAKPDPESEACATLATCVAAAETALEDAEAALTALEADDDATRGQIKEAETAVTDAMKALGVARMDLAEYMEMQSPAYNLKALAAAVAVDPTGTFNPTTNQVSGGKVTGTDYEKAKWSVSAIADWAGSVYEKEDAATKTMDSVVVYTNIQDAANAKYNTYYAVGSDAPAVTDAQTGWVYKARDGVESVVANSDTDKPNVITLSGAVTDATRSLFDFAHGLTEPNQTNAFRNDGDTTDVDESMPRIKGMFNGVAGTFACDTGCDIQSGGDGKLSTFTGGWTFTADSNATVAGVLEDADYLDFGYWVQTMTTEDDQEDYSVEAFSRGADEYGGLTDVVGTASYAGAAAGLYSKREFVSTGDGDLEAAGRFTADASLTATFGQMDDSIAPNLVNSISGRITDFRDSDGASIDSAWRIMLNKIGGIGGTGTFGVSEGVFTGGTTTGGGTWSGQFYGTGDRPTGVAGEFDASFDNGEVIGAFGATK